VPVCGIADVGLFVSCCDSAEFFDLCEEILDQMPPAVDGEVTWYRMLAVRLGRDHGGGAPGIQFGTDPVDVERLVRKKGLERDPFDQRFDTNAVVALPWQENEARQISQGIDEGDNLGGQSSLRTPDGLILSPPFAPLAFW